MVEIDKADLNDDCEAPNQRTIANRSMEKAAGQKNHFIAAATNTRALFSSGMRMKAKEAESWSREWPGTEA
jgi:hypothetical protein